MFQIGKLSTYKIELAYKFLADKRATMIIKNIIRKNHHKVIEHSC